jgi:signal transduction histidine kinase
MKIDLAILITALLLNSILSLVVFLRNPRKPSNIAFMAFGGSIILWTLCNYLADNAPGQNLLFTNLTLLFGAGIISSLLFLSFVFPDRLRVPRLLTQLIVISTIINGILCLTNVYVPSVTKKAGGGVELTTSPLYLLYTLLILVGVILVGVFFVKQLRGAHGLQRSQIKLFMTGTFVYLGFAILSNLVLPLVLNNWSSSKFGPIFTVPFVAITSYAIVKHHLFDIRGFVIRIFAYAITLSIVTALYALIIILIIARFVDLNTLSAGQLIALGIPTIICALTFHPLQQFVDRTTTRIFYRESYGLREVLNKLSDSFVTETSIKGIMEASSTIVSAAIRPSWMYFAVLNEDGEPYVVSANHPHGLDPAPFLKLLSHENANLVNIDLLQAAKPAVNIMKQSNVALMLRLGKRSQPTGVILFGSKKTGSIYTQKDIAVLQIGAKNLAIALENAKSYEEIEHFNETLKDEVSRATTRLKHANEKLKSLDKLKDDFISMASHQFRTPASSVHQALQMINNPKLSDDDRKEMLKLAEVNSAELVSLVSTMLSISRLQAGRFMIDKSVVDLPALIDKVIETTTIVAEQKHTKLNFKHPDHAIIIQVDMAKIREAMTNYIENAIKYSPENSTVNISLRTENDRVYFEVRDQGMGVPEAERKNLFGKFYRAQNARTHQPDGNGIGLYVVRNIAEGHGGEAYYEPIEQGSLFGLWLPTDTNKV